jgi:hypothetical protein
MSTTNRSESNTTNSQYEIIPDNVLYQLNIRINQSIVFAEEYLIKNRAVGLTNNVIYNDKKEMIDIYDYCLVNNRLDKGEYALIAYCGNYDLWYVRKTYDGDIQFFHVIKNSEDEDYLELFIRDYNYPDF